MAWFPCRIPVLVTEWLRVGFSVLSHRPFVRLFTVLLRALSLSDPVWASVREATGKDSAIHGCESEDDWRGQWSFKPR